jgi:hypothetical protein
MKRSWSERRISSLTQSGVQCFYLLRQKVLSKAYTLIVNFISFSVKVRVTLLLFQDDNEKKNGRLFVPSVKSPGHSLHSSQYSSTEVLEFCPFDEADDCMTLVVCLSCDGCPSHLSFPLPPMLSEATMLFSFILKTDSSGFRFSWHWLLMLCSFFVQKLRW